MAPKLFNIDFDNENAIFYSGKTISGKVIIEIEKPYRILGIRIQFTGEAKTGWTEIVARCSRAQTSVSYHGHETYLGRYHIVGGKDKEMILEEGRHCYPFKIYLHDCPASFEHMCGSIRYKVKVTIDRLQKSNFTVSRPFKVLKSVNLNSYPKAQRPVKKEMTKTFWCTCFKKGSLTLVLFSPFTGYIPHQSLPVTVEIDNPSTVNITNVIAYIKKEIKFTVTSPSRETKCESEKIAEIEFGPLIAGGSRTKTKIIQVPNTPPSGLNGFEIINIEYYLKVKAFPEGCRSSLDVQSQIILGTVPLNSLQKERSPLLLLHQINVGKNRFPRIMEHLKF